MYSEKSKARNNRTSNDKIVKRFIKVKLTVR
jgi:hypothetical protein